MTEMAPAGVTGQVLVVIPAFNEEARIAAVVRGVKDALPAAPVLVVNDGSRDATVAVAVAAGAVVVSHPINLGYGAAIQTGYKYAVRHGFRAVAQIDGDGQHDPAYLPRLLAAVLDGRADLAIGSRFLGEGSYHPPLARRAGMWLFRKIVSLVTGQRITDSTTGYQALGADLLEVFAGDFFPVDYPDADLLIAVHRAGFRIEEVPVRMFANAAGKSMHGGLKPLYYIFKMSLSILVTLLRRPVSAGRRSARR